MRHITTIAAIGALFALSGCFFFRPYDRDDSADVVVEDPDYAFTYDAQIQEAWVGGEMADLGQFEGDAYEATYYGTSITLHAGQEGGADFGWAMIRLSSFEGFEGDAFEPGTTVSGEDAGVSAQGCTGPSHGNYIFDGTTNDVTIVVEEGPTPTSRLFHYTAQFDSSRGGETHGSFVLEVN